MDQSAFYASHISQENISKHGKGHAGQETMDIIAEPKAKESPSDRQRFTLC
jgi:hypothetical protein